MGTAIFTGVTGLLAHQRRMDVVGNNIANINTVGYRGSRMLFQELFSQTLQGSTAPGGSLGGTNPRQVGLGVNVSSVDVDHGQGPLLTTGVASDLAIQGNGFFVLSNGTSNYYTRDGSFALNSQGLLYDPSTGLRVRGYSATDGVVDTNTAPGDITIPIGSTAIVQPTSNGTLAGNLNAAGTDTTVVRTLQVYDSLGTRRDIEVTFTRRNPVTVGGTQYNAWTWSAEYNGTDVGTVNAGETGVLLFDESGSFFDEGSLSAADAFTSRANLANANEISVPATAFTETTLPDVPFEFSVDFSAITDLAATSDVSLTFQDGYPRGVLESFSIGGNGEINGVFSNGLTQVLGQIALANFGNVGGLARYGDNTFVETTASGVPQIGVAATGGRGTIQGSSLESSNVDLGTEFSNLIVTQRGYQANARTVTAADTMLQEAVNLVR